MQDVLAEARSSMSVRGRDAMSDRDADAASAQRVPAQDDQGRKFETGALVASQACRKRAAEMAREMKLLQELYAALIAPMEEALVQLEGAEEVIVELLMVPVDG